MWVASSQGIMKENKIVKGYIDNSKNYFIQRQFCHGNHVAIPNFHQSALRIYIHTGHQQTHNKTTKLKAPDSIRPKDASKQIINQENTKVKCIYM